MPMLMTSVLYRGQLNIHTGAVDMVTIMLW